MFGIKDNKTFINIHHFVRDRKTSRKLDDKNHFHHCMLTFTFIGRLEIKEMDAHKMYYVKAFQYYTNIYVFSYTELKQIPVIITIQVMKSHQSKRN